MFGQWGNDKKYPIYRHIIGNSRIPSLIKQFVKLKAKLPNLILKNGIFKIRNGTASKLVKYFEEHAIPK